MGMPYSSCMRVEQRKRDHSLSRRRRPSWLEVWCWFQLLPLRPGASVSVVPSSCGIYLAPSTIPNAGHGVFAGDTHYKDDDVVSLGDLAIPIVDYDWNNQGGPYEDDFFLWNEYGWTSSTFPGMDDEGHDPSVISGVSPGVGALPNGYSSMMNIMDDLSFMGRGVEGNSPGIGASTLFYGRHFYATKDIPPGSELFLDYGKTYFRHRTDKYGYIPDPNSFISTDLILHKYLRIKRKVLRRQSWHDGTTVSKTKKNKNNKPVFQSVAHTTSASFANEPTEYESNHDNICWIDVYNLIRGIGSVWVTSRILNGLPEDAEHIEQIMLNGGASQQHYNRSIRELAWLEENGQCMDNIKPGNCTSVIPDAGMGAYANRFIPKGGLVAPAPLIHVQDYNALKMFQPKYQRDHPKQFIPDQDGPFTFQLLVNYCFGHEQSTLLLCPYGQFTSFINHSSEKPNARIQWSERMRHSEWREQPIYQLGDTYHTGLQFDFIALRDIEEDEEILIDYGSAWESAWQEHANRFVPREGYIPAFELNEKLDLEFRDDDDDEVVDYEVHGVFLMCHGWYIRKEQYVDKEEDAHCRILKNLGNHRYVVQVLKVDQFGKMDGRMTIEEGPILWNVPVEALFFKDMPNSRDHYQPNAFRHPMIIPDDIFPEVWKNKKRGSFEGFSSLHHDARTKL